MIAFGPVPSRRFDQSLGINNLPKKLCTYSCVYCQVGKTLHKQILPEYLYQPEDIFSEIQDELVKIYKWGKQVDYLTFMANGEPTLDMNLGEEIKLLKLFNLNIAVITNSSLLSNKDIRNDLMNADCVSLKIDTIDENDWHIINNPEKSLNLDSILEGILEFSSSFKGKLITETMLIDGVNTDKEKLKGIAQYIRKINPFTAYIAVPIRPPVEKWVKIPSEHTINQCYQIFKKYIDSVKYLIGYEGNNFTHTRNVEEDILSITAVHPMRFDALNKILEVAKADWKLIEKLIDKKKLKEVNYYGNRFYMQPVQSKLKKVVN